MRSSLSDVERFELSYLWADIKRLLDLRLQDNFRTFMTLDLTDVQLRSLQASTVELSSMLDLPRMLKTAIEIQNEEKESV